jgi:hypothetical protein
VGDKEDLRDKKRSVGEVGNGTIVKDEIPVEEHKQDQPVKKRSKTKRNELSTN